MDVPKYLQILWSYKWLLLVGLVVAVVAAFLAGFTLRDGAIVSRATSTYSASTTVLVGSDNQPLFQAEIPGQPIEQGTTAPVQQDLTSTAVVYAYLISGSEVQTAVEAIIGDFADDETLTAVRRTTQPGGNEQFPGRLSLPILDVVGVSPDPSRAEEISRTANTVFQSQVVAEQDAASLAPEQRVQLTTVNESAAIEGEGSNPAIPIVVTGLGVFLVFVALAFVLYNAKLARQKRGRRSGAAPTSPPSDPAPDDLGADASAIDAETPTEQLPSGEDADRVPALAGRGRTD